MKALARLSGALSALAFAGFAADVTMGALRRASFLSDLHQMLLLFAAATCFVVLILAREGIERPRSAPSEGR